MCGCGLKKKAKSVVKNEKKEQERKRRINKE